MESAEEGNGRIVTVGTAQECIDAMPPRMIIVPKGFEPVAEIVPAEFLRDIILAADKRELN